MKHMPKSAKQSQPAVTCEEAGDWFRLHKVLWVQDACHIALLNPLQRKRGNESGTDTGTILGGQDLDGIFVAAVGLGSPVKNLAKGGGAACLEVRVFVKHGAISTDVGTLKVLLLANGSNTASRETGSSGSDQFGSPADELKLRWVGLEVQLVQEKIECFLKVLEGVTEV